MTKHDKEQPEWLSENADGSVTVTLRSGLNISGTRVTAIRMREPTVNDQVATSKIRDDVEREINLFANLTMQAPDEIKQLTMRDYARLQSAYTSFLD